MLRGGGRLCLSYTVSVTTRNVEGGGGGGAEGGLCLSYTVSVTTVSPLEMLKGGVGAM